jgi:hypothetical protein
MRILAAICMSLPMLVRGQVPTATLDTNVIRVGEQAVLLLTVDLLPGATGTTVEWPLLEDRLGEHIEIVSIGPPDTVVTEDVASLPPILHLVRELRITSFDTGFRAIPPFKFIIGGTVRETAPLLLEVRGVDLGDEPALRDIKPLHEIPFSLMAWFRGNWYWIVAILALGAFLYWLAAFIRDRQQYRPLPVSTAPEPPLHERILARLKELEDRRLWQNGLHKEYHSTLTDLLRHYIEERYGVAAMERTTDELMRELRVSPLDKDQLIRLRNMLELSDMVKFAKAVPSPEENEQMMLGAVRLVKETARQTSIPAHA